MEKTQMKVFGRRPVAGEEPGRLSPVIWRQILLGALSFFCGQAVFFGGYAPMGLAVAGAALDRGPGFYVVLLCASAGLALARPGEETARYVLGAGLLVVAQLLVSRRKSISASGKALITVLCLAVGGVAALVVRGTGAPVSVCLAEAAAAGALSLVFQTGVWPLLAGRRALGISESLCLVAVLAIATLGGTGIRVAGVSLVWTVSAFLTLAAATAGGVGAGAATGVLCGLLLMLCGEATPVGACLLAAVGLSGGVLRPLGRWAVLAGLFVVAVLAGIWLDPALLTAETFVGLGAAGAALLLIPRRFLAALFAREEASEEEKWRALAAERLEDYQGAFASLAAVLTPPEAVADTVDPSEKPWLERLRESQALLAEQTGVVAGVFERLQKELETDCQSLPEVKRQVESRLERAGGGTSQVWVWQDRGGAVAASVLCKNPVRAAPAAQEALEAACGVAFSQKQETYMEKKGLYRLRFRQRPKYRLTVAMAGEPREGCPVSGDSHAVVELLAGGTVMALSDGMGSGEAAAAESRTAVEFLEDFLTAGFPLDLAVRLMNAALCVRGTAESFATLDLCYVDTDSGKAQFVKTGAAAAYILRDKKVKTVLGRSLPAGLWPLGEVDRETVELMEGDLLVLLTDGVAEALERQSRKSGEVPRLLRNFPGRNPRDLAEYLLEAARDADGGAFRDDATVLVSRLWEKAV